jgi:hypothetical protein
VQVQTVRNAELILFWKSKRKRPRERTRLVWEDNIKMDLREICWVFVDWVQLTPEAGSFEQSGKSFPTKYGKLLN